MFPIAATVILSRKHKDNRLESSYHGFKDFEWKSPIMKFIDTPIGSLFMMILILSIVIFFSRY